MPELFSFQFSLRQGREKNNNFS